jgi:hypothetical protein
MATRYQRQTLGVVGMNEQVHIIERRYGVFPARFSHQGQLIQIDVVERCWTEMGDGVGRARYHFRIRCGPDRFRLSEDTGSGAWTIRPES